MLHVDPDRCYPDYKTMFDEESRRPDGIQAVSVATTERDTFRDHEGGTERGLHVVCENRLFYDGGSPGAGGACSREEQGRRCDIRICRASDDRRGTASDTGRCSGEIRIVNNLQFSHGFHNAAVENTTASTKWRVDPKVAGPFLCTGGPGTHPLYLSEVMLPNSEGETSDVQPSVLCEVKSSA